MIRLKLNPGNVLHLDDRDYTITGVREGGSAVVYGAVSPSSNEQYVIKEIYPYSGYNPISATRDPKTNRLIVQDTESKRVYDEAVARFQNEIALLAEAGAETFQVAAPFRVALDNPGYGVATSFPKDLQSLENWINGPENKSFSSDLDRIIYAIKAVRSLLSGLSAIHDKGILHLDISTGNLFIGKTADHPVVFFLDFGCAVKFTRGVPVRIDHHMTTQAFAAPERMISKTPKDLFEATDLFSVAMILFHMIIRFSAACPNGIIKELPFKLLSNDCLRSENYIRNLAIPGPVKNTLLQFFRDMFKLKPLDRVFQTAEAMNERLSVILEICTGKGAHPECVALSNRKKLEAMLSRTGLLPDLLSPTYRTITLTQNTLLLGDGGTGKTTLMLAKWRDLLDEYDNGGNKQIPVWISLSSADGTTNYIRRQIARYIELDGANDGEYINKVEELLQKHTFTIFLDGINEARNVGEIITELTNMQKGCFDNCTIIVSSRTDYSGPFWNSFERVSVAPLDADAVQHVLKERTVDYRSLPERLQKTLLRPMFLVLYLKLVKDKTLFDALDEVNTPGEILYAHITRLANLMILADAGKKDLVEYAVWYLLPRLAFYGKMYMSYQEADELVVRCSEELAQSNTRYRKLAKKMAHDTLDEDIIEDILIPMGIVAASDKGYAFSHENYLDFFTALYIKQEMEHTARDLVPTCLTAYILPKPILMFIGDLFSEYRFIQKTTCDSPASPLENYLQDHCRMQPGIDAKLAVRNIIDAMKYSRENCITGNYSRLDLSAVNFYGCRLPQSCFDKSLLAGSTFVSAGHRHPIRSVAFWGKKYYVSCAVGEETVKIWNVDSQQLEREVGIYVDYGRKQGLSALVPVYLAKVIPSRTNEYGYVVSDSGSLYRINTADGAYQEVDLAFFEPNNNPNFQSQNARSVIFPSPCRIESQYNSYAILMNSGRNIGLFSCSLRGDKYFQIIDTREGRVVESLSRPFPNVKILDVVSGIHPGEIIICLENGQLLLWNYYAGQYETRELFGDKEMLSCQLAVSKRDPDCIHYLSAEDVHTLHLDTAEKQSVRREGDGAYWDSIFMWANTSGIWIITSWMIDLYDENGLKTQLQIPSEGQALCADYQPDTETIVIGTESKEIIVFDPSTKEFRNSIGRGLRKNSVGRKDAIAAVSRNANRIARYNGDSVVVLSVTDKAFSLTPIQLSDSRVSTVVFSPDSGKVAVGGDNECLVFCFETSQSIRKRVDSPILAIKWITESTVFFRHQNGALSQLDTISSSMSSISGEGRWNDIIQRHAVFDGTKKKVILTEKKLQDKAAPLRTVECIDVEDEAQGKLIVELLQSLDPDYGTAARSCAELNFAGSFIISGDYSGKIRLWDAKNGALIKQIKPYELAISGLAVSTTDDKVVVCYSCGKRVVLQVSPDNIAVLCEFQSTYKGFHPDWVVFADSETLICKEEAGWFIRRMRRTGRRISIDAIPLPRGFLNPSNMISDDGKHLLMLGHEDIHRPDYLLLRVVDSEIVARYSLKTDYNRVLLSKDGTHLIAAGETSSITIYQIGESVGESYYSQVRRLFCWDYIEANDIIGCDFRTAVFPVSAELKKALITNGGVVEERMIPQKYSGTVVF